MSAYSHGLRTLLSETGLLGYLTASDRESRGVSGCIFLETAADVANGTADQLVLASAQAIHELTPEGLVGQLARAGAAGLVVRTPALPELGLALQAAAEQANLPLVMLPPSIPWTGLLASLQGALDGGHKGRAVVRDTLLDLAEALSRETGNPVTIEDPQFSVLAYSSQTGELDPVRVQTILSKRAPEAVRTGFATYGVMRTLAEATGPVRIEAIPAMGLNGTRVVVPVRSGGTLLGYIWVIESARRLPDGEMTLLATAARTVAENLLEQQAGRGQQMRLQAEFLQELFLGRIGSEEELSARAQALGVVPGPARLALVVDQPDAGEGHHPELAAHCRTALSRLQLNGLAGEKTGGAWVLLALSTAVPPVDALSQARALGEGILAAAGGTGLQAGISALFRQPGEARQAALQAQSAARLARALWRLPRITAYDELGAFRLLEHLGDAGAVEAKSHPVIRMLARYDRENGTDLLPSLAAYLEAAGSVRKAARSLTIHPNTMLYRLQRMAEVAGFDAQDPGQRFVLELEFRLRRLAEP